MPAAARCCIFMPLSAAKVSSICPSKKLYPEFALDVGSAFTKPGLQLLSFFNGNLSGKTQHEAADALYAAAERHLAGHKIRNDYTDGDPDWESDFAILKETACAACLKENGFQDSEQTLRYLESEAGKKAICNLHVDGICNYIQQL